MCTDFFFSYFITDFVSQFEMNAEMDISKNQWRSTGGKVAIAKFIGKMQKKSGIMKNGLDAMPLFLLDDLLRDFL